MRILTEASNAQDLERLREAWRDDASFLWLGQPCSVDPDWIKAVVDALPSDLRRGHFALLTSGTTGQPRLVIGEKERAERLTQEIHHRQELDGVRANLLALPLSYSYAFVNQWLWGYRHDVPVVHTGGLANPSRLLRMFDDAPAGAMLCLVGAQVPLLRNIVSAGRAFPAITRVNFAGGAFPQHELDWLAAVFPQAEVFHNYGCTEALPRLCIRRATAHSDPAVLGEPLEGIALRTSTESVLEFRSPYAAVAVADRHGLHRFGPQEWITTGDIATRDADGHWILQGRRTEVFKRFGEKVSLSSLMETVASRWTGAAAFYFDPEAAGTETAHVLVLAPPPDSAKVRELLQAFREHHRRPHWPVRVEGSDAIPLSPNGKPDTRALASSTRYVLWRQIGYDPRALHAGSQ